MGDGLRKRAVVVGSREEFVRLTRRKLDAAGYLAVSVTPLSDAWNRIRAEWPDLIVLDPMEPYGDAFALVRALKANDGTAEIPLMMMAPEADGSFLNWPEVPLP